MDRNRQLVDRDNSLTFVQVVCAFAVITLHTNGAFWFFSSTERYWFSANIIECVFFFAVPIFFMISGITLMDYQDRYSTKIFFQKRVTKTLIPYLVWSLLGLVYFKVMDYQEAEMNVKWFINGLLNGKIISIYWFFAPLFCIYLSMPFFAAIDKEKKEKTLKYLLCVGIIINTVIPFLLQLFTNGYSWPYSISAIAGYLIWPVAGYVLYKYPPNSKVKVLIYVLAICGLLMHICGTYILSMRDGQINSTFKGYNNLPSLLYSIGVFVFLINIGKSIMQIEIISRIINFIGRYTFAIYLMHWFVLNFIMLKFHVDTYSIWWRLGAPIPIGLFVIAMTWLLRKIPLVRDIVP